MFAVLFLSRSTHSCVGLGGGGLGRRGKWGSPPPGGALSLTPTTEEWQQRIRRCWETAPKLPFTKKAPEKPHVWSQRYWYDCLTVKCACTTETRQWRTNMDHCRMYLKIRMNVFIFWEKTPTVTLSWCLKYAPWCLHQMICISLIVPTRWLLCILACMHWDNGDFRITSVTSPPFL